MSVARTGGSSVNLGLPINISVVTLVRAPRTSTAQTMFVVSLKNSFRRRSPSIDMYDSKMPAVAMGHAVSEAVAAAPAARNVSVMPTRSLRAIGCSLAGVAGLGEA